MRSRSRAGFSLIEALVASAVLGVAVTCLTQMYTTSVRGYVTSARLQEAVEIAAQRAEQLATMSADDLPACTGPTSCRSNNTTMASELSPASGFACTSRVDAPAVVGPSGTASSGQRFRIDTVVGAHPDGNRQPDARLVTVSVCWSDPAGFVHEVQAQRLMVPGA